MHAHWLTALARCTLSGLLVLAGASALTDCSPDPRYVTCAIDTDCRELGGKYRYCLMKHCVECVGSSACVSGFSCRDGACVPK
ncbi:MAG: hypothetical protein U0263_34135 [Polyangiaceae bacterium]